MHNAVWPSGLGRGSASVRLLGLRAQIPPRVWLSVMQRIPTKFDKSMRLGKPQLEEAKAHEGC